MHGAAKAGKDAGELCGHAPVGIKASTDIDAILALDADCVSYTATADLRPFEAIDDICRILASGKNVVSSSVVPLVHPKSFLPEWRDKLEAACAKGRSSFFTSGIDPGFANDILPLVLSGLSERWDEIRIQEIINYATYDQPQVLFETMGFGKAMDHVPLLLQPGVLSFAWGGTVRLLADNLHFLAMNVSGSVYLTTVFADKESRSSGRFKAVHTRHEFTAVRLTGWTSRPEQYYGYCQ